MQVTINLQVSQSHLQVDIPVIWVDLLMLQVTKKIQFDENITSWWKYYEFKIILGVDKNMNWGKLKVAVKNIYKM